VPRSKPLRYRQAVKSFCLESLCKNLGWQVGTFLVLSAHRTTKCAADVVPNVHTELLV